jgi:hypothetical protein
MRRQQLQLEFGVVLRGQHALQQLRGGLHRIVRMLVHDCSGGYSREDDV